MRAMKPVADESFSGAALGLGDLGFMMWKNVIDTTAMDIDLRSQNSGRHCAAFDMPTGSTLSPRAFPGDRAILLVPSFPEGEIADAFFFVIVVANSSRRSQLVEVQVG